MIKKLLFLAIVTIVVTHTHTVYAGYIDSPQTVGQSFTPVCESGDLGFWAHDNSNNGYIGLNGEIVALDDNPDGEQLATFACGNSYTLINAGEYDWQFFLDTDGTMGVDFSSGDFGTLTAIQAQNATWGSPNGFWGDTTPSQIIGDMEASVQATGVNVWPLMTFVGIPIAFLIALYLVWLINKTLTPPKKSDDNVINPQGENFIYHSAEDLEFKREYGQKRKRGRPRKYPL